MFGDPTENPNGWTKLNVKEAVKQGYIARPLDGNHGEKHPKGDDYVPEGVPFLMAQDLKDKRVDFTSCHFITEEQASTLKKGWAKEGDVLLTHKGTIGRVAIVQPSQYENMLLTPQITYYRCLKDIDNEYLAAYFMTGFFVEQLERLRTGTTRACVTITQQEQLELIIPPVPMQREFVKFVNQSDKSKFVRFKSQFIEMFGDLDKNTKQFPNRKLNEISAYWNGLTYKPADAVEAGSGTLVLRSSNIQDGSLAFDDNVYVGCTIKEKLFVQDNDILMCSRNGSAALVGKTALIKGLTEPTTFGAFMMIIRSDYYSYLKTYFETPFFRNKISTGTSTINQITGKMLNEISLPVPDMDTVRRFEEFTHQSDKSK